MTHEYIGTKIVTAWPQEQDGQPGYAVKYADGYTSWSSRAAFEAAYVDIGHVAHLPPHQQRVIGEAAELLNKIEKLQAFTSTDTFKALPGPERDLLHVQYTAMRKYLRALEQRIAGFDDIQPSEPAAAWEAKPTDCPHAAPFRYCPKCVVSPCPIGLGKS